ncbi:UDP-N-acetylmuramate dehydrogenase [Ammonifex thiophilus]|uniref:UDP-N-acetylenolpyruvoylglucosamine reductase n=1 Tax=Ammonifex thiophilus TaxID=444093 RepID=A0A3D8P2W7_9THEO|nr:UDP-N-acetylmuramate dehydrogenase [Ammonifex thiophilus]RDV82905.1 UDP-N-acetylmuramate dehydrogenase [Ammonifex thiophilus]
MTPVASWVSKVKLKGHVYLREPMERHTTWRIGGPAEMLVEPADQEDLALILRLAREEGIPLNLIGNGSNILVGDAGVPGIVVKMGQAMGEVKVEGRRLRAGAGAKLARLAALAQVAGLAGLEFTCGIPASLGGAVVMNAGAAGQSMAEVVRWVKVMDREGRVEILRGEELGFGYRQSVLQHLPVVVLEVELELCPDDPTAVARRMAAVWRKRQLTQPLEYPSAGSVFKNPPGAPAAGKLIELAGGKGLRVGEAMVSPKHANFIVNLGRARATDVLCLIRQVQSLVEAKFGIKLEPEVKFLGSFGWDGEICA